MRTIKFRAKNDNGQWLYGDLVTYCGASESQICDWNGDLGLYDIQSETIGQYTGICDKNGKQVFEGDFVEYEGKLCYIAYLPQECGFVIVKPRSDERLGCNVRIRGTYENMTRDDIEVIGNIHDNKEWLT